MDYNTEQQLIQQILEHKIRTYRCATCQDKGRVLVEVTDDKCPDYIRKHVIDVYHALTVEVPDKDADGNPIRVRKPICAPFAIPCPACKGVGNRPEYVRKVSDVPETFANAMMRNFRWDIYKINGNTVNTQALQDQTTDMINNFADFKNTGFGFFICSQVKGSGKTYLASCLCNEVMERYGITAKFVSENKLISISAEGTKNHDYNPLYAYEHCDLLTIDDIGSRHGGGKGTDWLNDILFEIVDYRYQRNLPTIYTSNVKPDMLDFDNRIVDRILDKSIVIPLPECRVRRDESYGKKKAFMERHKYNNQTTIDFNGGNNG